MMDRIVRIFFLAFIASVPNAHAQTTPHGQTCGVDKHHWAILPWRRIYDRPLEGMDRYAGVRIGTEQVQEAECLLAGQLKEWGRAWSNTWNTMRPSPEELEAITHKEKTFWHYRQYSGIRRPDGALLVFINGFCAVERRQHWRRHQVFVLDGGDCYWQAVINLTEKRVEYFEANDSA